MSHQLRLGQGKRSAASAALSAAVLLGGIACPWARPLGNPLAPATVYTASADFRGSGGDPATDLSGIACKNSGGGPICLVVDDEVRFVQAARIGNGVVAPVPGEPIRIVRDDRPVADVIGRPPGKGGCPGEQEGYEDLDGEAVAYDGTWFYVAGSHGCSRRKGDFALSSFLLARLRLDDQGRAEGLALSHRLASVLGGHPDLKDHFTKPLQSVEGRPHEPANGLNIEGLAADGRRLFVGLRAPSLGGDALLAVVAEVEALFQEVPLPDARLSRIAVGENSGVRDLALLPDGGLLLLSGPAQEQDNVPYKLWAVARGGDGDLAPRPEARLLGCLADVRTDDGGTAKAEAVAVIGATGDAVRVLVLFDGLRNGGAREYRVPLRGTPC